MRKKLLTVVGPTAVGKSAFSVAVSRELGGEVINADSRQVYRRLDVGTAKPTRQDRDSVPHHLIDVVDPDDDYSLAHFLDQATAAIESIHSRSKLPVLVGGTGQYVWALLEGWKVPAVEPDLEARRALEERARTAGVASLLSELAEIDAEAAERVDPNNVRRVVRAIEVAHSRATPSGPARKEPPPYDVLIVGLTMDRQALYGRIDGRVDAMMEAGWPAEVEGLLDEGYGPELASMSSLGYAELTRVLDGQLSIEEATQRIKYRTHRFARSQYAWFRLGDERIGWFDVAQGTGRTLSAVRRWAED